MQQSSGMDWEGKDQRFFKRGRGVGQRRDDCLNRRDKYPLQLCVCNTEGLHLSSEHAVLKTFQKHNFNSGDLVHFWKKILHLR